MRKKIIKKEKRKYYRGRVVSSFVKLLYSWAGHADEERLKDSLRPDLSVEVRESIFRTDFSPYLSAFKMIKI